MPYRLKKHTFQEIASASVAELFGSLGFVEAEPGAFLRPVERIMQGFGFTLHRSYPQFCVPVGVSVPCLRARVEFVLKGRYPALIMSRRLGEFRNHGSGIEQWYSVSSDGELPSAVQRVHTDFLEQALPWLEQFDSLDSVAAEFYRRRIAAPTSGERRRPDPFAFAAYGWMLEELGNLDESTEWLQAAQCELVKPAYMKDGRVLDGIETGARQMPKNEEEMRLMELLQRN